MRSILALLLLAICIFGQQFETDDSTLVIQDGPNAYEYMNSFRTIELWTEEDGQIFELRHLAVGTRYVESNIKIVISNDTIKIDAAYNDRRTTFRKYDINYISLFVEGKILHLYVNGDSIQHNVHPEAGSQMNYTNALLKLKASSGFNTLRLSNCKRTHEEIVSYAEDNGVYGSTSIIRPSVSVSPSQIHYSSSLFSLNGRRMKGNHIRHIFVKGGDLKLNIR